MKKYLFYLLLVLYYSLLIILVILMNFRVITITFLSFVIFSIIDLFLLKILFSLKYKIGLILIYIILSFLLCNYIIILIEEYYPPLSNAIIHTFFILVDFLLSRDLFSIFFFIIFIVVKIFPCAIIFKYTLKK